MCHAEPALQETLGRPGFWAPVDKIMDLAGPCKSAVAVCMDYRLWPGHEKKLDPTG